MATTFPQDKNVYAITDTVIRQIDCQYSFGTDAASFRIKFLGDSGGVAQLASSYREGSRIALATMISDFQELSSISTTGLKAYGKVTSSVAITKKGCAEANIVVSVPYSEKPRSSGTGVGPDQTKIATWSEKSTKYQFPLAVYAGEQDEISLIGDAGKLVAWQNSKGTNDGLYKNFKYEISGDVADLSGRTLDIAKKIYANIDTVERAYPEVVRVTRYENVHNTLSTAAGLMSYITEQPNLYYIDNATPSAVWSGKFPDTSWLKTAYDVETEEGEYADYWNITVTEAWTGVSIEERGPWDENLYGSGASRWKFATTVSADN